MRNLMDCSFANREENFIGSKDNNIGCVYSSGFIFNETIRSVIRRSSKDVFWGLGLSLILGLILEEMKKKSKLLLVCLMCFFSPQVISHILIAEKQMLKHIFV